MFADTQTVYLYDRPMSEVGDKVRKARERKGLSRPDVHQRTGKLISPQRLANYEYGIRSLGLDEIKTLSKALEVPVEDLLPDGFLTKGVTRLPASRLDPDKLAAVLDEIDQYESQNHIDFSNAQRAHLIKRLYAAPNAADYRTEIAEVIELSEVLRR